MNKTMIAFITEQSQKIVLQFLYNKKYDIKWNCDA